MSTITTQPTPAPAPQPSPENPMVDKIRALLRKTTDRGATQAEMENAMEMAQKLMTKYDIDKVTVMSREAEELSKKLEITKVYHETGRQRYETDQYIARILHSCFSVRVLWSSNFEFIESKVKKHWDGTPRKMLKNRLVYVIIGDKEDIQFAIMILEELHPIMRRALNAHLRAEGQVWSAITCHSFFDGLTEGYIAANKRGKEAAMLDAGKAAADRYALVLVDKDAAAEEYIKQNIRTVRARTMSGGCDPWARDDKAYDTGKKAGAKLKLGLKKLA